MSNKADMTNHTRNIVIVLGMHRSGTSVFTGALKIVGFDLGRDIMQANEYNVKGYFDCNRVNLKSLDGSPNSFRGLDAAINLARYCHATITGTYVLEIVKPQVNEQISSSEKILLEHAQKIMKKAKLKSAQHGILF